MTDYRDQHKVCIVRDADPGASRPHQLESNGGFLGWAGSVMAEVLHEAGIPWSTDEPLPEGVFRSPDGRLLATCEVARRLAESDDWTAHNTSGVGGPLNAATIAWTSTIVEVRRVPKPKTERVPWHEAVGRTLTNGTKIGRVGKSSPFPFGAVSAVDGPDQAWKHADLDGMVEVLLNEDDQDGAA